jgi:hypothetical protein
VRTYLAVLLQALQWEEKMEGIALSSSLDLKANPEEYYI